MKTISDFTIYCTESQTRRALELGAPLEVTKRLEPLVNRKYISNLETYTAIIIPTAEQLIGWLEEQGIYIEVGKSFVADYQSLVHDAEATVFYDEYLPTLKEATLAAIDAALEYITQNKK